MGTQIELHTIDFLEKILNDKKVDYIKTEEDQIVAQTNAKSGTGHKFFTELSLEKINGEIRGFVFGYGEDLFDIDPVEAVNEYTTRSYQVKSSDGM